MSKDEANLQRMNVALLGCGLSGGLDVCCYGRNTWSGHSISTLGRLICSTSRGDNGLQRGGLRWAHKRPLLAELAQEATEAVCMFVGTMVLNSPTCKSSPCVCVCVCVFCLVVFWVAGWWRRSPSSLGWAVASFAVVASVGVSSSSLVALLVAVGLAM